MQENYPGTTNFLPDRAKMDLLKVDTGVSWTTIVNHVHL